MEKYTNPYRFETDSDQGRARGREFEIRPFLVGLAFTALIGCCGSFLTFSAIASEAQQTEYKAIGLLIVALHVSLGVLAAILSITFKRTFGFLPSRGGILVVLAFSFILPLLGVALSGAIHNSSAPVATKQAVLDRMLFTAIPLTYLAGFAVAVLRSTARHFAEKRRDIPASNDSHYDNNL